MLNSQFIPECSLCVESAPMKRRLSSLITAVIFLAILWLVLDRMHIVIWVNTPWWGLLLMGIMLFLIIDFAVSRIVNRS